MDNMQIYNAVREVPKEAQKTIAAGRLKGMTDINPMWRMQALTEQFGPVGIGWYYNITHKWIEDGANDEKCAFVDIQLFIKNGDEWSKPIEGTGGSKFVAAERGGLYTSDEAYKMALTDAISVACKALGMGANVYWQAGRTKYTSQLTADPIKEEAVKNPKPLTATQKQMLHKWAEDVHFAKTYRKSIEDMTNVDFGEIANIRNAYETLVKYVQAYANTKNVTYDAAYAEIESTLEISLAENLDKTKEICKKIQELAGK